jgi:hypothetical protein
VIAELALAAVAVGGLVLLRERLVLQRVEAEGARAIEERRLALEERRLAMEEKRLAANLEPEEIPADLQMRFTRETEPWAREQVKGLIQELFGRHKSWDAVRAELQRLDTVAEGSPAGWSQTRAGL